MGLAFNIARKEAGESQNHIRTIQAKEYIAKARADEIVIRYEVVATGETHSVREFAELAFRHLDLDYREFVEIESDLFRPAEVFSLTGDATKARKKLGWNHHCKFEDLVIKMVESDFALNRSAKS